MQRAAAYIRVSTDDQVEYSPDAQRKSIEKYAKANNMQLLSEYIFIDEGISGRKAEKRPAFMRMIATAKQKDKHFDVILVHKFDRFARSREDSVVYKSLLRKQCGVKVISITETIEDDKFSIILESMLEAMAEYYSLNLADEVKKGMTEKATRGEYQTAAALGYKNKDKTIVVDEDERKYIEYVFNEYAAGVPMLSIARNLTAMGCRTHRGNVIENRTVDYILNNPLYIGKTRWNPTGHMDRNYNSDDLIIVDGVHEAIITQELWDACQERLALSRRHHTYKARPSTEYKSCLSSLVKCGSCGRSLSYAKVGMQCIGYSHGQCKVSHNIKYDVVLSAVEQELERISQCTDVTEYVQHIRTVSDSSSEKLALEKEISRLTARADRLKTAYLDGVFDLTSYKNDKQKLDERIAEATEKIKALKSRKIDSEKVKNTAANALSILRSDADNQTKNAALKTIIEKIVFVKSTKTLVFYYLA